MASSIVWVCLFLSLLFSLAVSQTCSTQKFKGNDLYPHCLDLPSLTAYLHFNYDSSNETLSVVFTAPPAKPGGWVAWAINPTGTGMPGAQSLVAYRDSKSGGVKVDTYNVSSYKSILPSKLAFDVWEKRGEEAGEALRIFAKVKVPADLASKGKVNQVWQVGPGLMPNGLIEKHDFSPANLGSKGELDLSGGQKGAVSSGGSAGSRLKKKNIHGILNAVSWGILFPIGAMIARYMRTFESADPLWFYAHVSCQFSAYAIGVAGWGTGLKLGSESKGIQFSGHRNIGIALFSLATVQMFALLLRPKRDHKYRLYWNVYHHGVGYSILVLGIINVFKGLDILNPAHGYKTAYIVVIAALGGIAVFLELVTWIVVFQRKSSKSTKPFGA